MTGPDIKDRLNKAIEEEYRREKHWADFRQKMIEIAEKKISLSSEENLVQSVISKKEHYNWQVK